MTPQPQRAPVGIEIDGVHVAYGDHAVLRNISVAVLPGEMFALLGPSGSGKSTLLRLIAGFNAAAQGAVRIGGIDVARLPPWKRNVGMVFQNYALWPHLSVAQNIAFGLEERRWSRERIRERVREMLALVSLSDFGDRRPSQLSGGQQQRVAIIRALATQPRALLLDEITSALDPELVGEVLALVRELKAEGMTMLIATHEMNFAGDVADQVCFLHDGRILERGPTHAVLSEPQQPETQRFLRRLLER